MSKLLKVGQYIYDEPANYDDFTGGINTDSSNENILKNQLRDALNMHYDNLTLRKRFGASKHADITFNEDLNNVQGIFLFTQTNPWILIAANGKLYYGLYSAGGTIELNDLPIRSKIALTGVDQINSTYQLYNIPVKTVALETDMHTGYFLKADDLDPGQLIFQNTRDIEGVPHKDKFYIATGTRIVEIVIENEKPSAYIILPYKPTGIEFVQIGPNLLSPFPNLAINPASESVKTAIHGIIPIALSDGTVKLQTIMSYEQGKSANDYRFKWEKITNGQAEPVFDGTYYMIFDSELNITNTPMSQGKDSIIISSEDAENFTYRATFAREFERIDETNELSGFKVETIITPNGSYQDWIINQLIDWFGSATSTQYTEELKTPNIEWARISTCTKVTGDGNKLLFYDGSYNSGSWYKTIIDNPAYITHRGGLNFKTTYNEQLIKVIDFKGIIVCFSYNPYLGGNISIVTGNGDDYNDGGGNYSPYARRVVNKQITTDNAKTVHIAENIIVFKYKDVVYMIEGSQLSNEIVSVQSINDHIRSKSPYFEIPWADNDCIGELTEDYYALIWKERSTLIEGKTFVTRPAQRVKMYYKLAFQHGGRIIFPWLRDESNAFNVDHMIQIGRTSYHLYDNLLISYDQKQFTDLDESYDLKIRLRGYDCGYNQYIKMLHKASLYYFRGDSKDIDIIFNVYNEANYLILKDPSIKDVQQNLAVQYYDQESGNKKVDNTLLDVRLFTASIRFPALFVHAVLEVKSDEDFAFVSIGFIYKTKDLPKTTLFDFYKSIWTDPEKPMVVINSPSPLNIKPTQSAPQVSAVDNAFITALAVLKKDFVSKTDVLNLFAAARDILEYDFETEFPAVGKPGVLYLAKFRNTALEGEEPVYEDYNMLYRYSAVSLLYIPVAGAGTGGTTTSGVRLIPVEPVTYTTALGNQILCSYNYINDTYTTGTRILYINDIVRSTTQIQTGPGFIDVTNYMQQGLNTIRIYVTDPEGRNIQTIFRVTTDTIVLSSTFMDSLAYVASDIVVPYLVTGNATVREMHFFLDGDETTEIAYSTSNIKNISGLTHGAHVLEFYCNGIFKDVNGNTLYEIESNHIRVTLIYNDGVSSTVIIASKFNQTSIDRGVAFDIDYVVYSPVVENVNINLLVDSVIVNSLTVDDSRHYWSLKTLLSGPHTLRIEAGAVFLEFEITINEVDIPVEIVQDSFLKLYLSAFGKTNSDIDRELWENLHGNPITVDLIDINYASTGWIDDSLRLIGDAHALIGYQPFATSVPPSGRTIELDFTTRNTLQEDVVLLECLYNDIGFVITPQKVTLKGSNTFVESNFKEDEHIKIGFTIMPGDNIIITYINGVISGLAFYSESTSFRQLIGQDISLNPGGGSVDFHSIRVYERALTAKEMLENYIAELGNFDEIMDSYEFNDVYDEYGNPSKTKMAELIPIMMLDAPIMPQFKGDKRPVMVTFEHPFEPEKNFIRQADKTVIDWQGTSSIQYPVKNFKITMNKSQKYEIEVGWIAERKFCLKADYMDSSHTHNTGLAKLFDTMYSYRLPPGVADPRIRSTVYGYPLALFYRSSPAFAYVYQGVYNFNLDKDCTDTFGLVNTGDYPLCQSFEVSFNADSGAGAFADNVLENVIASFEARFPELDEDVFDYDTLTIYDLQAVTAHYAKLRALIQWVMDNNNLSTFKDNFDLHFDREYTFKYLIATLVFGLVDNLGKNMMINTWDGEIFFPNFYDIDTAIGLENQGKNIHDYDIEIGDIGSYATSDSLLWVNILTQFNLDLRTTYRDLRGGIFSYENILLFLKTNQIDKISESQYNLDAYAKYIGVTTDWLWMAQGTSEAHMKRWMALRLAFLDSKYVGGEFAEYISLRINVVGYQNAHVTMTPLITQYCTAKWSDTPDVQVKTTAYNPVTLTAPSVFGSGAITNVEVFIYGAKYLASIGDLSDQYLSSISTEFATRITHIKVGDQDPGYQNIYLKSVTVGQNTYLEEIDVTNCINLGTDPTLTLILNLSGAKNIKRVYAGNTQLKGITFASGAALIEAVLPASIQELVMINMIFINPNLLTFEGVNNIQTLRLENIPAINVLEFFNLAPAVDYLRLTGIVMSLFETDFIDTTVEKIWDDQLQAYTILGINSIGQVVDDPVIVGTIKILTRSNVSQGTLDQYALIFPDLDLTIVTVLDGMSFGMINDAYALIDYDGTATVINIPEENHETLSVGLDMIPDVDDWKPVTAIGPLAFDINATITEINIPDTITFIGERAFKELSALTKIKLPNNLPSIERYTFDTLPLLASVDIPTSVTHIKNYAFKDLNGLLAITIPNTVLTMDAYAFYNTPFVTIFVEHESKPIGWSDDWYNNQLITILWGISSNTKTFIFDTQGGSTIDSYEGVVVMTPPVAPTKFGYDFTKWQVGGQDIVFPYIPDPQATEVTLTAVWTIWTYTIEYYNGVTLHDSHQTNYGSVLGQDYLDVIDPVSGSLQFSGQWNLESAASGLSISENYSPDQDALNHPNGYVIKVYALFYNTAGLVFTYDAPNERYDVTGWSLTTTGYGYTSIHIPDTWNDGINGLHPVYSVCLTVGSGAGYNGNIGRITIAEGIKEIKPYAFYKMNFLRQVVFLGTPTCHTIGAYAFRYSSVYGFYIPQSITTIDIYGLALNAGSQIYSKELARPAGWVSNYGGNTRENFNIIENYYDDKYAYAVKSNGEADCYSRIAYQWSGTPPEYIDGYPIVKWLTHLFHQAVGGKGTIYVPDKVQHIGDSLFWAQMNTWPGNISFVYFSGNSECTYIGKNAFSLSSAGSYCYGIMLPPNLTTTGEYIVDVGTANKSGSIMSRGPGIQPGFHANWIFQQGLDMMIWNHTEFVEENNVKYSVGIDDVTVVQFLSVTAVIPETVNGLPVKHIPGYVNRNNDHIILQSVTIPTSITDIGPEAFRGNTSLTTFNVPANCAMTSIATYAFYGCTNLQAFLIPKTVTTIGHYAFMTAIACNITLEQPATLQGIGMNAFERTSTTDFDFPDTVINLSSASMKGCGLLVNVKAPFVGTAMDSTGQAGTIRGWFSGLSSASPGTNTLITMNIDGVGNTTYVPSSLRRVVITQDSNLESGAFSNAVMIEQIELSVNLTNIESYALSGLTGMTMLKMNAVVPPTLADDFVLSNGHANRVIKVPVGSGAAYQAAQYWSTYAAQIVEDTPIPLLPASVPFYIEKGDVLTFNKNFSVYGNVLYWESLRSELTEAHWGFLMNGQGFKVYYNDTSVTVEGYSWDSNSFQPAFENEWLKWSYDGTIGTLEFKKDWPLPIFALYKSTTDDVPQSSWQQNPSWGTVATIKKYW